MIINNSGQKSNRIKYMGRGRMEECYSKAVPFFPWLVRDVCTFHSLRIIWQKE